MGMIAQFETEWWLRPACRVAIATTLTLLLLATVHWSFVQLAVPDLTIKPSPDISIPPTQTKLPFIPPKNSVTAARGQHFGRMVWMKDITSLLQREGVSAPMSQEVARWLMIYCRHFRIPPDVALAIMYVESSFDRFAVSSVGAQGLMQIMPFWRKELGGPEDNLFNIEVNIRYGCAIIRRYLNRYSTLDLALAAYNGSIGSLRYVHKVRAAMQHFGAIPTLADLEH